MQVVIFCKMNVLGEILSVQEQLGESEMSLNRFRKLTGHFKNDVKRLSLVADGAVFSKSLKHTEKCPYCNGTIKSGDNTAYIEGSRAELGRIVSELSGLQETEQDEIQRHAALAAELRQLEKERAEIDALVSERLQPREYELNSALKDFRAVSALQAELELIKSLVGDRMAELESNEDDRIPKGEYRVKDNFPADFTRNFREYVWAAFENCRYANLSSAYFDTKKFEVFVNGDEKATDHGKGYRAFINTTLALAFRKYLLDKGKYSTGLFVVDSPLLTLKQGVITIGRI
jgi:DNA repair exonuclease SbcCD ATPase subunit